MNDEKNEEKQVAHGVDLALNPWFSIVLQQVLQYAVEHAQDIADALLRLLGGKTDQAVEQAAERFKVSPSADSLGALGTAIVKSGLVSQEDVSAAILNEVAID